MGYLRAVVVLILAFALGVFIVYAYDVASWAKAFAGVGD